jgi:peptidoglycan/LPS O-acetylase OafA/YrhL
VVLYHAGGVLGMQDWLHGELGVDIFVILSGIGLTLSTTEEGPWSFVARRFWRIYPAYWVALTAFLVADAALRGRHFSGLDIALHYLGIHAWFGDAYAMSINDSFWFITLILTLYVVFVGVRRLVARPDVLLLAGALLSLIPSVAYLYAGQAVAFEHLSLRLPGFFVGLLVGRLLRTGTLEVPLSAALACAALLVFYVPYTLGFLFTSAWVACALMAAYAFLVRPMLPAVALRDLKFLGVLSLEIFLLHQPLIREYNVYVLRRFFGEEVTPRGSLLVGMAVGLVLAVALGAGLHALLKKLPYPFRVLGKSLAA